MSELTKALDAVAALPSNGSRPKGLVGKLAEVMAVCGRIPKRGRNDFHGYDYATEADIADAIRHELAQRSVMLVPGIESVTRESVGEKGSVLTTLAMTFTFLDGETGETLQRGWMGAGTDKEDKGLYKAITGGEKYFLLKTFLMATGDDPERDEAQGKQRGSRSPEGKREDAAEASPVAPDGATQVVGVDTKHGKSKAGRAWTSFTVRFEDGRSGATFDSPMMSKALIAQKEKAAVYPTIEPNGRYFNLIGLETEQERAARRDPDSPEAVKLAEQMLPGAEAPAGVDLPKPPKDGDPEADRAFYIAKIQEWAKRDEVSPAEVKLLQAKFLGAATASPRTADIAAVKDLYNGYADALADHRRGA